MQTLRVNNSKILTIKNPKFSGYYFYTNLNVWGDFQICISVPLIISLAIWVFSFIYFIDFEYFVIFSSEEQIYLFIFIFITMTRVLLKLLCS